MKEHPILFSVTTGEPSKIGNPRRPAVRERPILFSAPMVRALLDGSKTQTRRVCKPAANLSAVVEVPDPLERGQVYNGSHFGDEDGEVQFACPYGGRGDRLWVRETWQFHGGMLDCGTARSSAGTSLYQDIVVSYPADGARVTLHPSGQDWPTPKQPPQREGEVYSLRDAPADFAYTGKNTYHDRLTRWWNRKIPAIHMPRWASRITLEITSVRVERLQDISEADALAEGVTDDGSLVTDLAGNDRGGAFSAFATLWEVINGADSWDDNPWVWVVEFRRLT